MTTRFEATHRIAKQTSTSSIFDEVTIAAELTYENADWSAPGAVGYPSDLPPVFRDAAHRGVITCSSYRKQLYRFSIIDVKWNATDTTPDVIEVCAREAVEKAIQGLDEARSKTIRNQNPKMLLRIAQADAYCMACEYVSVSRDPEFIEAVKQLDRFYKHPTHKLGAGCYTDDTQMSIAVAEQLLSGEPPTKLSFANHFMQAFLRDKRDGYSRGFQAILEQSSTGQDLLDKLVPASTKNGAAMRSVPLGFIKDVGQLLETARIQASVTHDTPDGVTSSQAVAFISHQLMHTDDRVETILNDCSRMFPHVAQIFTTPWTFGRVVNRTSKDGYDVGLNTVWAVATLLRNHHQLPSILRDVIEWGGDTDSVAAIAWGLASIRFNRALYKSLEFMETDLEPGGEFGPEFLIDLGERLLQKYGQQG